MFSEILCLETQSVWKKKKKKTKTAFDSPESRRPTVYVDTRVVQSSSRRPRDIVVECISRSVATPSVAVRWDPVVIVAAHRVGVVIAFGYRNIKMETMASRFRQPLRRLLRTSVCIHAYRNGGRRPCTWSTHVSTSLKRVLTTIALRNPVKGDAMTFATPLNPPRLRPALQNPWRIRPGVPDY